MKSHKRLPLILALCFASATLSAQTADEDVTLGRAALAAHNLAGAYADFSSAVTLSPTNETANALLAVTRLLVLPQQPAGSNFLTSLGFAAAGRNLYDWTATLPKGANGKTLLPSENSSVAIAFYRSTVIPALGASWTNLARIADPGFTLTLTAAETSQEAVTVDYGDLLLMQAELEAGEFLGYTLNAQNFDFVASQLQSLSTADDLTIQEVLATYPSLLKPNSAADLANSKTALTSAIASYQAASAFIRNQRQPGQGLFVLNEDELDKEAKFRTDLTNILLSLNGPVPISPKASFSLDLGNYFAGTTSVRSLVPQFSGDNYRHNSLPDYTFGGILVGEPAYATESLLRQKFDKHDYSGIYAGQVSDNYVNDSQSGNSFAVFVSTNQQATVIGFDPGEGIAFYAQGSLDKGGNVEFTNSLFSGYGSFGGGQCYLELDFTNGLSVYPYGGLESPLGPYQSGAGAYSGTYSGVASGTLKAIFAADGELFFAPLTSGRANDGGLAEMEAGDTFYGISVGQTEVMGSYSPHTLSFTGTYLTGYESGGVSSTQIFLSLPNPAPRAANAANGPANSLALTRSDSVPFDVPPVFSAPPVNQTAGTGSNAVFSVTATGSAPLCYQWFANGVPINGATAASLVVSNVSPALSGNQYSVTAENVVGAASAAATLTVLRTSVKPVVTNLNLTAGQQVGAGLFTVTGNAGDVSGVAGVWYQLNNGAWTLASTTNHWTNWSATLSLTPGPNTLRTYAEDINSDGFLYVADNNNNLIRKITAAGVVTTLAGDTDDLTNGNNNAGYADGLGTNAWFNSPKSTAVDAAGDIYVSDSGNNLIRRLTPAGVVTTLAGDTYALTNGGYNRANNAGYADGLAAAAQFNSPAGLAVDGAGNLFVADSYNNLIRKITTAGVVTTLAGDIYDLTNGGYNGGSNAANAGYADGPGTNARFNYPTDVAVDDLGNVYVADAYNNLIRKITAAGVVTTLAGDIYDLTNGGYNGGSNGRYADGSGVGAAFHFPISTTLDRSGNLLVADCFNNLIRTITPAGVVTTLAGDISDLTNGNSNAGYADGPAAAAVFKSPIGTAVDGYDDVFVADYGNNLIRKLSPAGVVSTLAGDTFDVTNSVASTGYADGAGAAAQFDGPAGVAADGSGGNISPTNTVTFNYVVSAELTVLTNQPGWGVLSTNYNGVPLQIGKTYSVTATAKPGFAFTNWTGSLTTTNPILTFVMASNLTFTANFADTNRPTVAITSPAPNATETSSALTVTGTAADNVAVRSVWFQLNSNGWTQLTLNGGSNWTTQVTLTQPTNTLAVYAVDTSGNDSLTNRVSVAYVVSAALTVLTNQPGWGVLSTNYNGVPLQIGKTYSVTATAKPGFAFTNWTGSLTTTNPILTFVMASNLTFTANFVDTNRPTVAITSPVPNATETSAALTVTGTAADNVAVRSVWFQLNSNGWTQLTLNGGSNWTTQVTLTQPTNTLAVYAVDTSGNDSLTNRLSVAYVVSAALTVLTNQPGWGVLSTNYNGVPLQIGKTYSVTATAKPGFAFTDWTGSLTTTNPILTFVMASNLTFTANFADTNIPTLTITAPTPNLHVSNSVYTVTGTVTDNVIVAQVNYQLNEGGWLTASTANGFTNWFTTSLTLISGTNTIQAYAVDTLNHVSATNTVSFVNLKADPAPASLAGLVATVTPSGGSVITVGFGTDTYSQSATDTNDNYTVGTYAYTKLEANFARLVITPAAPFTNQSGGFSGYLTFNADGTGTFSNANNGDTGNISLAASSNLPPSSVAGKTALFISGGGVTTVVFGNGTLTKTGSSGQVQSYSYNYQSYSPVGALFTLVDTNLETNYLVAAFLATNHGLFYRSSYDADGALQGEAYGGFVFPSASPFAPASLNGYEARTTRSDESTTTVAFDASTFSMTASDTNHDTDVGDYTYKTIGVTNAQLTLTVTAPPSATNYGGSVYLTFVANNFCLFTNQDNGSNSISGLGLKTVANLVPSSLSGTVYATNDLSGTVDVVTFNSNGTFSQTESNSDNSGTPSQGTFTFTPYSPIGAMLQLKYTSPAAMAGTKVYSQVTYSQPQAGTYHATSYDTKGDQPDISTGTFSVH